MGSVHFHFDFISPYGYFASKTVEAMAARHGRVVEWHPMLLGVSVMKVMGLKPLLDTPLKGAYVRRDVARTARMLRLPIGRDLTLSPQSSLVPARALCWLNQTKPAVAASVVHAMYDAIWRDGVDLNVPTDLLRIELPPEIDAGALAEAAGGGAAADLLRAEVSASLDQGIFGSPTVVVDDEPFWGCDRLQTAEDWLASGGW